MESIWKYPLRVTDSQIIEMPAGAEILCVQVQHGKPVLYAKVKVSPGYQKAGVRIITHGTGHKVREDVGEYVSTYQQHNGDRVFHVFKQRPA